MQPTLEEFQMNHEKIQGLCYKIDITFLEHIVRKKIGRDNTDDRGQLLRLLYQLVFGNWGLHTSNFVFLKGAFYQRHASYGDGFFSRIAQSYDGIPDIG
jgi:hypothetical protein